MDLCQLSRQIETLGASLVVLDDSIDTSTPHGRLFFHLLASIGEFERSLILQRTEEGRKKALSEGVKFGRKEKLSELQKALLKQEFNSWKGTKEELAKRYEISVASLYRIANKNEDANPHSTK
jgi:DNA invertase Pin-like site-specific DNA recombinase